MSKATAVSLDHLTTAPRRLPEARPADPCVMVIFGATGDLTRRDLVPSLFELACEGLLPERFAMVGFARRQWSDEELRRRMREAVGEHCSVPQDGWDDFARRLYYVRGDFTAEAGGDYARLADRIDEVREAHGIADNVFFHLAAPPAFFPRIARRLGAAGMAKARRGWRRLVIEKPFGEDQASARALDRDLREIFAEDQIYRIDHFLGKETVQNMLVFRFANPAFEPIWNRNFIDHVQITVAESIGIGTRAGFYEQTGVLRDMVQNHLLQLLCITAIEPPLRFDGGSLRDETVKVLQALVPPPPGAWVVGQYGPGTGSEGTTAGYRQEKGVAAESGTPTYAALRLTMDNWRWAGVPFYLRTGKRLPRKLTEVSVQFKPTPHLMFPAPPDSPLLHHVLTFRLQPEEGILQTFVAKRPGPELELTPVTSRFLYADAFGVSEPPRAYAWLLRDVMKGEQTLFARADWIDAAWGVVDPIIARLAERPPGDLPNYPAGSWGPRAAADLLAREGRAWREE